MGAKLAEIQVEFSNVESEVLRQFVAGDLSAFEALFRHYQATVYRWIVRIVRDVGAAEDITVETFWRIYRARERFDPARSFGAWARRIATNSAIDYLKTVRPEESLPCEPVCTDSPDFDLQQHIRQQTERAFQQLPVRFRTVAMLALIDGCPYEEIAEALDISVAAVKSRVFRAVRLLRKKLKQLGVEP